MGRMVETRAEEGQGRERGQADNGEAVLPLAAVREGEELLKS